MFAARVLMSFPVFSFTAKLTLLWITGALIFGGIPARFNFRKYHQLAAQGVLLKGMVTALEPSNHQFVGYSYEANGRIFKAEGVQDMAIPHSAFSGLAMLSPCRTCQTM